MNVLSLTLETFIMLLLITGVQKACAGAKVRLNSKCFNCFVVVLSLVFAIVLVSLFCHWFSFDLNLCHHQQKPPNPYCHCFLTKESTLLMSQLWAVLVDQNLIWSLLRCSLKVLANKTWISAPYFGCWAFKSKHLPDHFHWESIATFQKRVHLWVNLGVTCASLSVFLFPLFLINFLIFAQLSLDSSSVSVSVRQTNKQKIKQRNKQRNIYRQTNGQTNNAIWDGGSTAPAKLLIPHRTQNYLKH